MANPLLIYNHYGRLSIRKAPFVLFFREDLFHRLNVIPIHVPSLDERKDDIPALISYFTEQICQEQGWKVKAFEPAAIAALQARSWTGNIRELRNVVERLIILASDTITKNDVELYS